MIGSVELLILFVVGASVSVVVLYVVIRLGVRDGIRDADRKAGAQRAAEDMRLRVQQSRALD
jgi:hypothetical protein